MSIRAFFVGLVSGPVVFATWDYRQNRMDATEKIRKLCNPDNHRHRFARDILTGKGGPLYHTPAGPPLTRDNLVMKMVGVDEGSYGYMRDSITKMTNDFRDAIKIADKRKWGFATVPRKKLLEIEDFCTGMDALANAKPVQFYEFRLNVSDHLPIMANCKDMSYHLWDWHNYRMQDKPISDSIKMCFK